MLASSANSFSVPTASRFCQHLLERNAHGITLTEFGRTLLNRSHAAFDELRQGVKDIEFLADPTAGEFSRRTPLADVEFGSVLHTTILKRRGTRAFVRPATASRESPCGSKALLRISQPHEIAAIG